MFGHIAKELKRHIPFTAVGAASGVLIMLIFRNLAPTVSQSVFYVLHPMHVVLSALVTAGMYRLHSKGKFLFTLLIGYFGSVGIATLSDSLIPYLGEALLNLPERHAHIGFVEKWWLVNSLAVLGVLIGYFRPTTRFPHAGHVLVSTWASLFHVLMALGGRLDVVTVAVIGVFLFLAVWIPCCLSDIVFPLLFAPGAVHFAGEGCDVEEHTG